MIDSVQLWSKMSLGEDCQIIDVREPSEFDTEHIAGSKLVSLSSLKENCPHIEEGRRAYLVCRSGKRAQKAADQLAQFGIKDTAVVQGGIQAWMEAGYPVQRGNTRAWSLERQVRFTAGSLVLIGVVLGSFLNANWFALSAFVGLGMVFSAVTDSCAMGMLLARMPWNQAPSGKTCCK